MESKVQNILITGGSGLVGRQLTNQLLEKGKSVSWLSRSDRSRVVGVDVYQWDISKMTMDSEAMEWADAIIHLAGEGVANKRWADEQKTRILKSRVNSTKLLCQAIKDSENPPSKIISASAIGYYGLEYGDKLLSEEDAPGTDFLAEVTKAWEHEVDQIAALSLNIAKLRIGVVLSENGGALEEISKPIKLGLGAALGSGRQVMSWVHVDDLCGMIEFVLESNLPGTFNAVSPNPVTNREMSKAIAHQLRKPFFLPAVPSFVLKLLLGELSQILLSGSNVSSNKIEKAGYGFKFPRLSEALENLLR